MIIERPEILERINFGGKWVIVYGRRKTGKTFLVENFVKYDDYFFVNRDMSILSKKDGKAIGYDALLQILERGLADGKCEVVDEFHRLGDRFFDAVHSMRKSGRLILLTSTLFMAKKLLSGRSPLLGLFHEAEVPIVSLNDSIGALAGTVKDKAQLLESAIMLREPTLADYFGSGSGNARKTVAKILLGSKNSVPAMIGEIFLEEEKSVSATYEGIIRAVASGRVVSGEISSGLFSMGLLPKDDPSTVQPYLNVLVRIGVLKRLRLWQRNKFVYKIGSPLAKLFFYADEKYGISERDVSDSEAERIVDEVLPRLVEDNVREHMAHSLGLTETVLDAGDYEVDGVLLRFNKPAALLEVKWTRTLSGSELRKVEDRLGALDAGRRFLFVRDKKGLSSEVLDIIDPDDLLRLKPHDRTASEEDS